MLRLAEREEEIKWRASSISGECASGARWDTPDIVRLLLAYRGALRLTLPGVCLILKCPKSKDECSISGVVRETIAFFFFAIKTKQNKQNTPSTKNIDVVFHRFES